MCLMAWRWHPDHSDALVLLSNRDEYFDRPTDVAQQWPGTQIWAGRDQRAGGTWLGVTATGRLAAITNYRTPDDARESAASRGHLVAQFLASDQSSHAFMAGLADTFAAYNPFNLTVYDVRLCWASRGESPPIAWCGLSLASVACLTQTSTRLGSSKHGYKKTSRACWHLRRVRMMLCSICS